MTFPIPAFDSSSRSRSRARLAAAFPQVDAIFQAYFQQKRLPGMSYGIIIDGELAHAGNIGYRNVLDQTPATSDTVFRIASMTKSFTAMAILILRDAGKLRLDEPAVTYVPELASLVYPTADAAPVTVRHLMTMSAGFPEDNPWADRQLADTEEELSAKLLQGISFSNAPGIAYEYSNFGWAILGRIVTNVSGMSYQAFVNQRILQPLGMTSTTNDLADVSPDLLAMGYRREDEGWTAQPPLPDGAFASIGAMFTTMNDFTRYVSFLLSAYPPRDDADDGVLKRSSLREMMQPYSSRFLMSSRATPDQPALVSQDAYAYGLVATFDSLIGYSVSHGGGLPGYGSFYRFLPYCGVGIAVFTNMTYAGPAMPIGDALAALHKTGGLVPRPLPASLVLLETQAAITRIYNDWDEAALSAMSANNFFQDISLERRSKQVQGLRADFGKCSSTTPFEAENALRGRWTMKTRKGRIEVFVTLAPTVPPTLQMLEFTAAKPLSADFTQSVESLIALVRQWDDSAARDLFARSLKPTSLRPQLDALRVQYGDLRLGDNLEGDGKTKVRVRLIGTRGSVDVRMTRNAQTGKLTEIGFQRPRETMFVP
jgi:CubicO group peptidase (beta-lactamase class C family)